MLGRAQVERYDVGRFLLELGILGGQALKVLETTTRFSVAMVVIKYLHTIYARNC